MSNGENITYFGETDFRNKRTKFGIKQIDRTRHVYIIGKTGMGKSTVLENMAAQDILNGEGMCFIDPHGSAIDTLLEYIPSHRIEDVVYFAPFDTDNPISFNVLESVEADKRHLVVSGLMASFKKIWADAWSARMEYILTNTLLALLEYPKATLLGVNRMLTDKDYRDDVIKHITDASVLSFWLDEYNKWDIRYAREAGAAIQNKIGQFTANPLIRNIIGQEVSTIDFRKIMDERKILLINLSKGRIGEANGALLGGMLITKIYLAAMSRADVGASNLTKLPPFFLFVDEFQNFATESFADILSEARKYNLALTVAHQYVEQMQEEVAAAIFGNVGTMITFRIGPSDAEVFEKQFAPTFTVEDIVNLGKYQIYLSLMIDGIGSRPFSARTMAPIPTPEVSNRDAVIEASRRNYAQPRALIEEKIKKWFEPVKQPEKRSFRKDTHTPASGSNGSTGEKQKARLSDTLQEDTRSQSQKKDGRDEYKEENAEEEMKTTVSSRLNSLLEKITSSPKSVPTNTNASKAVAPMQKERASSTQTNTLPKNTANKTEVAVSASPREIKKDRSAQPETASSLQQVLQQALRKHNREASSQKKETTPSIQPENTVSMKQEGSSTAQDIRVKEVPEDILKKVLDTPSS